MQAGIRMSCDQFCLIGAADGIIGVQKQDDLYSTNMTNVKMSIYSEGASSPKIARV